MIGLPAALLIVVGVMALVVLFVLLVMRPKHLNLRMSFWPPQLHLEADSSGEHELPSTDNLP